MQKQKLCSYSNIIAITILPEEVEEVVCVRNPQPLCLPHPQRPLGQVEGEAGGGLSAHVGKGEGATHVVEAVKVHGVLGRRRLALPYKFEFGILFLNNYSREIVFICTYLDFSIEATASETGNPKEVSEKNSVAAEKSSGTENCLKTNVDFPSNTFSLLHTYTHLFPALSFEIKILYPLYGLLVRLVRGDLAPGVGHKTVIPLRPNN